MFSSIGYLICIPFAWLLRVLYNLTSSYGIAIILFTLVIKLVMLPFQMKSKKSMMRMSRMSGKMEEIKKKYANNQMKMQEEMQKLYAEEGINPMGGCLWSFLPLPILIALYSIIRQPITHFMMMSKETVETLVTKVISSGLAEQTTLVQVAKKTGEVVVKDGFTQLQPYGQIKLVQIVNENPQLLSGMGDADKWIGMDYNFIGLDLTLNPTVGFTDFSFSWAAIGLILIPIVAGLSQLVLTVMTMKQQGGSSNPATASTKGMMYTMPLMSVYIGFIMPAALGIYWIAQSVFSLIQEYLMGKFFNQRLQEEEDARYEALQADRQRRIEEGRKKQQEQREQAQQQKKQTLKEKQKAAQAAKAQKAAKAKTSTTEAGRVGDRPYARGRAYKADRYDD